MSQVVQAKCPHCQHVLRIPAEWVSKAMRCKHCKRTFQARTHTSASANAAIAAPAAKASTVPVAQPAKPKPVPVAKPANAAAPPPAPLSGNPFGFDEDEPAPSSAPPRRRRKSGLLMVLVTFVFLFMVLPTVAGLAIYFSGAGATIYKAFTNAPHDPQVAKNDTPKTDTPPAKSKTDNPPPDDKKNVIDDNGKGKKDPVVVDPPNKDPEPPKKKKKVIPVKDPDKDIKKPDDPKKPPIFTNDPFPRRALLISVNNYLFYNTVHYGSVVDPSIKYPGSSTGVLRDRFTRPPMNFPATQVIELSDGIPPEAKAVKAHSTQKSVLETTIKDFVDSSRAQDRIVVLFAGHAAAVDDKAYLVPIDGNLKNADSLVPLQWVYDQLAACKAQQKILILDVFRFSPSRGSELAVTGDGDEGTMPEAFDKALLNPPAGVQVWSACSKHPDKEDKEKMAYQNSVELDGGSAFLQALCKSLMKGEGISDPTQPIDLEPRVKEVNEILADLLKGEKGRVQVSRLTGVASQQVVAYNREEALPLPMALKPPTAPAGGDLATPAQVNSILEFFRDLPPVRETRAGERNLLQSSRLPAFAAKSLDSYKPDGYKDLVELRSRYNANKENFAKDFPLRAAVLDALEALAESNKIKMYEVQRSPVNPMRKAEVEKEQRVLGESTFKLEQVLAALKAAGEERDKETSRRWQANYDYTLARMQSRLVYLIEYNYVLAAVRRDEMPELTGGQDGWRIGTGKKITVNERKAKDIAKDTKKIWDRILKQYPDTPWSLLATREREMSLGLEWRPKSN